MSTFRFVLSAILAAVILAASSGAANAVYFEGIPTTTRHEPDINARIDNDRLSDAQRTVVWERCSAIFARQIPATNDQYRYCREWRRLLFPQRPRPLFEPVL